MSAPAWIAVGLFGGLAAAARFAVDAEIAARVGSRFPFGILAVNLSGAFALGGLTGAGLHGEALVVVAGGAIGSYTTFSTWILDSHRLRVTGEARLAGLNIVLSLLGGFAALILGRLLGQLL